MVRVTSGKWPHLAHLTRTQLSTCFIKEKPPFRTAYLEWQGQKDSNPRHSVLETDALPTELYPYQTSYKVIHNYHQ